MAPLFRAKGTDFDRLYRDHVASVYRYAFAVLGNHPDAEDVTQQTFLNAYRAIAQGTKPRKAENWLVTIAHNEVRRHFRENGRPVEVELDERLAHRESERSDPSLADVLRALQKLPPTQRSALVMREFEGRSYAEIAQLLELTQSALEALLFRARRGLAEHLEEGLTCAEAEQAVSLRLDGRLARREGRRLRKHLRECTHCVRFVTTQKRQRALLKGLSVMPIPASLYLFRPEPTAAAGLGAAGVAVAGGGSAAVAGGSAAGAGAIGIGTGLAAKAAAVAAVAAVVGGVGYEVAATAGDSAPLAKRQAVVAAAADQPARTRAAEALVAQRRTQPISSRVPQGRKKAKKSKTRPPAATPGKTKLAKPERTLAPGLAKKEVAAVKVHPAKPTRAKAKPTRPERAPRPEPTARPKKPKPVVEKSKPTPPTPRLERPKPLPPAELPALPDPAASVVKKLHD
jgi:RNA polymerase sigma factor (sigma-70 family)